MIKNSYLKEKALSFIDILDEDEPDWIKKNNSIADAFVEFHIISSKKEFKGRALPTETADIVYEIRKILEIYYSKSEEFYRPLSLFTDEELFSASNEVAQLRADLSVLLYQLSDKTFREVSLERSLIDARKEKAEGIAYKKAFKEAMELEFDETVGDKVKITKMSPSLADSYARKTFKTDELYLQELNECNSIDNQYWILHRVFEQAKEAMNAMAKEIKK